MILSPPAAGSNSDNDNLIPRWFYRATLGFYPSPEVLKCAFFYDVKYKDIINEANDTRQQLSSLYANKRRQAKEVLP